MKLQKSLVAALCAAGLLGLSAGGAEATIIFQFNPTGAGLGAGLINGGGTLDQLPSNDRGIAVSLLDRKLVHRNDPEPDQISLPKLTFQMSMVDQLHRRPGKPIKLGYVRDRHITWQAASRPRPAAS